MTPRTSPPSTATVRVEVIEEYLADEIVNIEKGDAYFSMIHMQWGEVPRRVFAQLPDPDWDITAAS